MRKKLTISVDEKTYHDPHSVIEKGKIGKFIESLVLPRIIEQELALAYQEMAKDPPGERQAKEWIEGLFNF